MNTINQANKIHLNIKKTRIIRGKSREYMADVRCVSVKQYANLENGKCKIDIERLLIICNSLNVSLNFILNFKEDDVFGL